MLTFFSVVDGGIASAALLPDDDSELPCFETCASTFTVTIPSPPAQPFIESVSPLEISLVVLVYKSPFVSTIMSRYLVVFVFEKLNDSPLIPFSVVSASTRDFPSDSSALRLPANCTPNFEIMSKFMLNMFESIPLQEHPAPLSVFSALNDEPALSPPVFCLWITRSWYFICCFGLSISFKSARNFSY